MKITFQYKTPVIKKNLKAKLRYLFLYLFAINALPYHVLFNVYFHKRNKSLKRDQGQVITVHNNSQNIFQVCYKLRIKFLHTSVIFEIWAKLKLKKSKSNFLYKNVKKVIQRGCTEHFQHWFSQTEIFLLIYISRGKFTFWFLAKKTHKIKYLAGKRCFVWWPRGIINIKKFFIKIIVWISKIQFTNRI